MSKMKGGVFAMVVSVHIPVCISEYIATICQIGIADICFPKSPFYYTEKYMAIYNYRQKKISFL